MRAIVLSAALALLVPATAAADRCGTMCRIQNADCEAKLRANPKDTNHRQACKTEMRTCPAICEAMLRHKHDLRGAKEETSRILAHDQATHPDPATR
jgi:hypothetical protein